MSMTEPSLGDWQPSELEENGRELLSRIREHQETIRDLPVTSRRSAADLQGLFAGPVPEQPTHFKELLDETFETVVPNLTQWHHPSFHAYFSNSSSGPAILAETLTAALNVNAMLWKTAPAAAAVEKTVLDWMAEMVGYPRDADGVLVNGASLATLYGLAAARDALTDLDVRERGLAGRDVPQLRLYTSDQTHSSVEKAAITLGIGTDNVVRLAADDEGRLPPEALALAIRRDLEHGRRPFAVVATVGTTSTGAIDPLPALSEICREHGIWLHVDAAYGGLWRLADAVRPYLGDLELADSLVINPHKVLFCPMEATALYCRRTGALPNAFRLVPEYLRVEPEDAAVDYMNYSLQLGRQFRALKIWWIIRSFGRQGLADRLGHAVELSQWLRDRAAAHPQWTVPADSVLPLVCLRFEPEEVPKHLCATERREWLDALNERICSAVGETGKAYLSHTVTAAGYVLRVSIGNIQTRREDVEGLWELLTATAAEAHHHMLSPTAC
ncbi:pyridoxal-dependent decarboxylase [Streptomyces sp. NBC_00237]|uniref:pyridoxal phosphate-dependent decarboxylase family protein n=1 Tax=Streptomyces sp. NBC_00237 TaxID=2975687 RepID=UPI00225891E4|nr:pyridoxal-dependent decarboxylase [Streptomyces sp. NBC_00237]MCX5205983.1 pyridoxal-dependent decarboxylase [Streptomyces sp. NBC_00237]